VLFLIDNTVATVPASLPQFDVHYSRFLQACYANKVSCRSVGDLELSQSSITHPLCNVQLHHNGVHVDSMLAILANWLLYLSCVCPCAICVLQKLFQAVEEARALLAEAAAAAARRQRRKELCAAASSTAQRPHRRQGRQRSQAPEQQQKKKQQQQTKKPGTPVQPVQVPAYPPPVREDMGRNAKQLLKWLKAAATDPEVG
jgi:hypothetical protein